MAETRIPGKVKLIAGLIACDAELLSKVKRPLEKALDNKIDFESVILDFVHTDYYEKEMGTDLKRVFFGFKDNISLESIYRVKIATNAIEKKFMVSGRRAVNIDPGYLDLSKLVLFSTKDFIHRIYLAKGIYAETTLFFKDHTFNHWPWTYPDYRTKEYIEIFNDLRNMYKVESRSSI